MANGRWGTLGSGTPEYHRAWRKKNHARVRVSEKRYYASSKGKRHSADGARRRNYGITPVEYDALVLEAAGFCQLCDRQTETSKDLELVLDHDHRTKLVRGLICQACNKVLGFMETHGFAASWVHKAERYLKGQ